MCWTPVSSSGGPNGPTERPQIKTCLMQIDIAVDGGGHLLRTNMLLCRGMRERLSFVVIWLASPKILDGPKHDFLHRNVYRCGRTIGHLTVREFTVPGGPLFLFALLVSS